MLPIIGQLNPATFFMACIINLTVLHMTHCVSIENHEGACMPLNLYHQKNMYIIQKSLIFETL